MTDYGMFEDAVYRDAPVADKRREAAMDAAYADVKSRFGAFLKNASNRDDYSSRLAMVEENISTVLRSHRLAGNDQNMVMAAVFAETQPSDKDNPAFMIPDEGQQSATDRRADKDNDVKLEHISRRRQADTHEHFKGEMPGSGMGGGMGGGGGGMGMPKQPKMPTAPNGGMPAAPKAPAAPAAPTGAPSMGPTSTPPSGPSLPPGSGKQFPGKVPGHGMPGQSPMGGGPPNPGKFKQMLQKVPGIGNAMKGIMNTPAHQIMRPDQFMNNQNVHQKLYQMAQQAGQEPRDFMNEHWDEMLWLAENSHALMEGMHGASTKTAGDAAKKGHDPRLADWFGGDDSYDPVQGLNEGDNVVTTIDTTDEYNPGNTIPAGTSGTVSQVDGDQVSVNFDGSGDATVDVQALQKTGSTGWNWDSVANSYKSNSSTFPCSCGNRLSGVGQHQCKCGKTWNISSFMSGSKHGNGATSFACREVKTDPKLVLANRRMADMGLPESMLPPTKRNQADKQQAEKLQDNFEPGAPLDEIDAHHAAVSDLAMLRTMTAAAGVWPIINDKDVQKNWQSLMGIVTDPSQVGALENPHFQQLIQELYEEIVRRGLHTPDPSQNSGMADPTQQQMPGAAPMGIAPAQMGGQLAQPVGDASGGAGAPASGDPMAAALQQVKTPQNQVPSQSVMSAYREGFKLARDGFVPFEDEPIEVVAGWAIGLNNRLATSVTDAYGQSRDVPDPYANKRDTLGDITKPHQDGHPVNNDSLVPGNDTQDPTQGMRDDFVQKMDADNAEGQSDDRDANHAEDFKPKSGPSYKNRKVDVN